MPPGGIPDPRAIARPLMLTGAMDLNTNPSWDRVTDPDMALSHRSGPHVNMTQGGRIGH